METKTCVSCQQILSLNDYSWKNKAKNKKQLKCKKCYSKYNREYYAKFEKEKQILRVSNRKKRMRIEFREWKKTQKCCICGEDSYECLDFHHLDPSQKEGQILEILINKGKKALHDELNKCIVVCSNCHRKIHSGRIIVPEPDTGLLNQSLELGGRHEVRFLTGTPNE